MSLPPPPWGDAFEVRDANGISTPNEGIPLTQVSDNEFLLGAMLHYRGPTGLDPMYDDAIRTLPLSNTRLSDLASVPAFARWFVRPHGSHTPAALFHDVLILEDSPIGPAEADRYFLSMLEAVGVPTVKRYIMWAAVALRTRWVTSRPLLILWTLLAVVGLSLFVAALIGVDLPSWMGGRWVVLAVTALAPLPASLLWPAQRGASLIAAVGAIWYLPVSVFAVVAIIAYRALEAILP